MPKFEERANRPSSDTINYLDFENPFEKKYGENWRYYLENYCKSMKKYLCITELVNFVYNESKKIMKNTQYENNWYFYHDALPLFVNEQCRKYMEQKGILKHWLLPENDLNIDTIYYNRPIGNSPDLNPLDCTLFKDLHEGVKKVLVFTRDTTNERKCDTILNDMQTYREVWKTCPSSERIIYDIDKVLSNMHTIYKKGGVIVDEHVKNPGRRYIPKPIREDNLPHYCMESIFEQIENIKDENLVIVSKEI